MAGISYAAWVGGICIALAIGFIVGVVISGARAAPIEQALVCKPDACLDGEMVFVPRAIVSHNADVVQKMQQRIRELERDIDSMLREAKRVCA